jgi:hypothetical protein
MAAPACNAAGGCSWQSGDCVGTPDACSTYDMQVDCIGAGCDWAVCTGTAVACSTLDGVDCVTQPGCSMN